MKELVFIELVKLFPSGSTGPNGKISMESRESIDKRTKGPVEPIGKTSL
ncbi:hypothetical protein [Vagococcus fluvialis]